jgi:putative holliday junction resolvase
MKLIGIDFGLKKMGVAIATSKIAEPFAVIRYENDEDLINKFKELLGQEEPEEIIIGISEGVIAQKTKEFIKKIQEDIDIPIQEFDETLSTQDAQRLAQEAGMRRKKRKKIEDAMAAAVILQNYIDVNL